jgi:2-C-methyl-D-erythritol 4-phosphate cytidylyltransferase/2-C-methyl-D-erythritol 2,4-cyclodiphosphate synthase
LALLVRPSPVCKAAGMRIAAILVAAGSGTRFGTPTAKQFLPLAGVPIIRRAAAALAGADLLQPVGPAEPIALALAGLAHLPVVPGGATRQASVRAGLEALVPHAPDIVLVHDAARPLVPPGTVAALLAAMDRHAGAIPALPVSDTIKAARGGVIERTVPRAGLFRAQTPQAFRFPLLLALHRFAPGDAATDDAALLEQAGHLVALVRGSEANVKITTLEDLTRMELGLLSPRVGSGFDVHAFAPYRALWLCGVEVPYAQGLAGHSDADVGLHALCDAIYGALAEGDVGRHFPPSDMAYHNADSADFVRHAAGRIAARGGRLANADVTLICEQPKITPHAPAMIARVAALLGVDEGVVSVKATTTERLGFAGRGEGIAAQASVLVLLP